MNSRTLSLRSLLAGALLCAPAAAQDGVTLFQSFTDTTTYLINQAGSVVRSWPSSATPALSVYLLPDGDMVRTQNLSGFPSGGAGGGIERLSYDGAVEWAYSYFTATEIPHHDIEVLPNGNVLMIVWEELGIGAALALGRNPLNVGNNFMPDAIYEVQQTGPTTGDIVWEWHAVDHIIQDYDSSLPGFGVVADHPELININYGPAGDWLHVNAIDYHPQFDQIALSVPRFHEMWIIDHSTTTAEAAGHTGGTYGKGGDLLYRWGNPAAYDRGTPSDQVFYSCHDVQWVEPGRPGEGNLTILNNGVGRPTGNYSSVDEWTPPVDGAGNYTLVGSAAYGPGALAWEYSDPGGFFSNIMSGAQRLESGNTLVCEATSGRLFEVTPDGTTVWNYINPFPGLNWVFKATRYADCDANDVYDGHEIATGAASDVNGNQVLDVCEELISMNYCSHGMLNSVGLNATISATGMSDVSANDLTLTCANMPPDKFGYFIASQTEDLLLLPGNTQGNVCMSGNIARFQAQVQNSGPGGTFAIDVDLTNVPTVPREPVLGGQTWYFQCWYRDNNPGSTSNFTDGLAISFY